MHSPKMQKESYNENQGKQKHNNNLKFSTNIVKLPTMFIRKHLQQN